MANILIVHPGCFIGGGGLSAIDIIEMLESNHDVKIMCSNKIPDMYNYLKESNFDVIKSERLLGCIPYYSGGPKIISKTFILFIKNIFYTWKLIRDNIISNDIDVVISNSIVMSWVSLLKNKNSKCKFACFVRETQKEGHLNRLLKFYLEKFDAVYYISEYDKKKWSLKNPIQDIINDCIKREKADIKINKDAVYSGLNLNSETFKVLFVGGDSELKGYNVITEAMESIDEENINLVISGYVQDENKVDDNRYRYIGIQKDIFKIYKSVDLLVAPSTKAHQLRPIFEAGFCKLPVITTRFEQLEENIKNNFNGITINCKSSDELAECILLMYKDKKFALELAENNYNLACKKNDFEKVKIKLIENIETILHKK